MSAASHPAGTAARIRRAPVTQPRIQATSWSRCGASSRLPSAARCRSVIIAAGVVVSRGSPGTAPFSAVSQRSRRNRSSPAESAKVVTAPGPPSSRIIRFAAVLSLYCSAAAQISATVMPSPACWLANGEYGARSRPVNRMRCCSNPRSVALRFKIADAASSLKALQNASRSPARCMTATPVPVFRPATPIRPPDETSNAAMRSRLRGGQGLCRPMRLRRKPGRRASRNDGWRTRTWGLPDCRGLRVDASIRMPEAIIDDRMPANHRAPA